MRLVKLLKKSPHIRNASETLSSPQSSQEEVGGASADVFKIVDCEHVEQTLTKIRLNKFNAQLSEEKFPLKNCLP